MFLSMCLLRVFLLTLSLNLIVGLTPPQLMYEIVEITKKLTEVFKFMNDDVHISHDKKGENVFETLDAINIKIRGLNRTLYEDGQSFIVNATLASVGEISTLNNYFVKMEDLVTHYKEIESSILLAHAHEIISANVTKLKFSMYAQVTSTEFLESFVKQNRHVCGIFQSPQEIFYNFFNLLLLTNCKAYVLEQMAYSIISFYEQAADATSIIKSRNHFIINTNNIISMILKPHADRISKEVWRCDPYIHIKDSTYLEITNFLHGYVINKQNLDHRGKCRNNCEFFKMTKAYCFKGEWCQEDILCSKIIHCKTIESSSFQLCPSKMAKTNRRYMYIDFNGGTSFGTKQSCTYTKKFKVDYQWIFSQSCPYCFCLCDEVGRYFSDRYINLRISMANISDNRVVTGLRFIKHNRIIHLQVQEGQLLERGYVDPKTVQWVPPENYKITDRNIYEGQDFHKISWEERSIELSKIVAEEGLVVTGARFTRTRFGSLDLQVMTTPFDFNTGKLRILPWHIFKNTPNLQFRHKFHRKVKLESPDSPVRANFHSNVFSHDQYVEFTNTDNQKDAGQTTVPFFDAQPVYSKIPTPLSGVGLFHKGRTGSGGFIASKIYTYDFSKHVNVITSD